MRVNLISKGGIGALIGSGADGDAASSSTSNDTTEPPKAKANDINHLIKRKKPEAAAVDDDFSVTDSAEPAAKKPAP